MSADSMNSVFGFIGILAVGCGIYCLYAYFNMKKDGHINETILLGKSYSEKMCKDKEAYLKRRCRQFWDLELFRFFMEL